jgi:periplasmic protein CpxP/Spy
MTKNKILILAIGALLATNIAMLVFFLNKPGSHKGFKRGREMVLTEFVQKDLGFSQAQMQQFDSLGKQHREKVGQLMDTLRNKKEKVLKDLAQAGFSDSAINESANHAVSGQAAIELLMLQHFKNIRNLCTPAQQSKFDTMYYQLWHRKGNPKK